jgi:hypothetical protein
MSPLPIYIYFHICCINNWKTIVENIFSAIYESGLYDKVAEIRCGVLGSHSETDFNHSIFNYSKVKILFHSTDLQAYERPTLRLLYDHACLSNEDFSVLYIHSKGVRWNGQNLCVTDWVKYLTYFNIHRYESCLNNLNHCNVVGVNLQNEPITHFSGNFWWSHANYIKTIDPFIDSSYNGPEFWITQQSTNGKIGLFHSLFQSHVNHYEERFTTDKYIFDSI